MDSAKEIARDMLEAINIKGDGFLGVVGKGIISLPVSLGYMGYDFIDTEHRRENQDDKFRMARLVKKGIFNRDVIEVIINASLEGFVSRVNLEKIGSIVKNVSGNLAGKMAFAELTGVKLGEAIASRGVTAFFAGSFAGLLLSVGAETSRAIYTSRFLKDRNPVLHEKLKAQGDLDLLYFLVEDIVKPFEKACEISNTDSEKFNQICKHFFGGL
ncbi:hypothetical protein [Enterobacter mori]|uniref:hypothetical protein n=1 Tax=Enterobacter mori TaxID=539813 RepID=UPI001C670E4D|nr:hypothetical protein [Enterobacter mori]MBW8248848.1 hypothetical protein [Enterobacter mori]MBW8253931.1 hypothetical protein [Enterobacter mori]